MIGQILRATLIASLFAVTACGAPKEVDRGPGRSGTIEEPATFTPGVSLSGFVDIGVSRTF